MAVDIRHSTEAIGCFGERSKNSVLSVLHLRYRDTSQGSAKEAMGDRNLELRTKDRALSGNGEIIGVDG